MGPASFAPPTCSSAVAVAGSPAPVHVSVYVVVAVGATSPAPTRGTTPGEGAIEQSCAARDSQPSVAVSPIAIVVGSTPKLTISTWARGPSASSQTPPVEHTWSSGHGRSSSQDASAGKSPQP